MEKDDTEKVWSAINDPDKIVIVQTAPAVRVALGKNWVWNQVLSLQGKWLQHCAI